MSLLLANRLFASRMSVPSHFKAMTLKLSVGADPKTRFDALVSSDLPTPALKNGEVLVKIHAAALNHRDVWIRQLGSGKEGVVLGSDGAGVIVASNPDKTLIGEEVIINPGLNWDSQVSGPENPAIYESLGHPTNGTISEYLVIPRKYVYTKPKHLSFAEAAALPLAGLTAWRGLFTQGGLKKDQTLLIPGIGGGVALFALQFAVAIGAKVYVTSSDDEKIKKAIALGATGGANYKTKDWSKGLAKDLGGKGIDLIFDGAAGQENFDAYLNLMKVGATYVNYGGTASWAVNLPIATFFSKQLLLKGCVLSSSLHPSIQYSSILVFRTVMGSQREFVDLVNFVNDHKIVPIVSQVFEGLEDGSTKAFNLMLAGAQFGKIVISMDHKL
ncbi:hypothetical protein SmJEL517_g05971 [Synchytrium microbalum]|uniref:Enoyl reductase (ER) domain-containing protein n=1 Tax=Synchytrium microbalum TaxID=1806994 RepID=A0A507BT26_9FUNG|nr:uncharacterized protein SmJEL517_g05971 [Synchytrium microbalum]TPX30461.1 hypothetical protein SmJEL517_g05971 [Synchytrium microbalum]